MSRIRTIIELKAPSIDKRDETLVSTGHKCEYCQGNGYFWEDNDGNQDPVKVPCPTCKGKGKLDAIISITWTPSSRE